MPSRMGSTPNTPESPILNPTMIPLWMRTLELDEERASPWR